MKEYLNITKRPVYRTMKTLLFFIPIGIITNNIYLFKYGSYDITWKLMDLNICHAIFGFMVFAIISFFVRWFEIYLFPSLIISRTSLEIKPKSWFDNFSKKIYGFNVFEKLKELYPNQPFKIEIIKEVISWPVIFMLWLMASNTVLGYISLVLFMYLTLVFGKIAIGVLNNYEIG